MVICSNLYKIDDTLNQSKNKNSSSFKSVSQGKVLYFI